MKNFKHILLASLLGLASLAGYAAYSTIPLGGSIFPLTLISQSPINLTDAFNEMEMLVNQQTAAGTNGQLNINTASSVVPFTATLPNNPLVASVYMDIPVASINAAGGQILLSGVLSRTIFPGLPMIMVSGTAATATSIKILCSPSLKLLDTTLVASLVTSVPVFPGQPGSTAGSALGNGCVSGDSIVVSNVGTSMTTTTDIYVNMPYTVQ